MNLHARYFYLPPAVNEQPPWNNSSLNNEHLLIIASHCCNMRIISHVEGQLSSLNHNSQISTQHWISWNLFIFAPMLIGIFCLFWGGEYPGKVCDIGIETPCIKYFRFMLKILKYYFIAQTKQIITVHGNIIYSGSSYRYLCNKIINCTLTLIKFHLT